MKESNTFDLVSESQIKDIGNITYFLKKISSGEKDIVKLLNNYCLENALSILDKNIVAYIRESGKNINEIYNEFNDKEHKRIDRTLEMLLEFRIIKKVKGIYLLNN